MNKASFSVGATIATTVAGGAVAEVDLAFELDGPGGTTNEYHLDLQGALSGINVAVDFTNEGGWTWAGDLLLGFVDPSGNAVEFGGFNLSFGFDSAGDFPDDWDSSTSGAYAHKVALGDFGLSGAGDWTILIADGYDGGAETDHWIGVLGLEGVEAVPAPGVLALMGLAGLAGRRRR